jgi:hypothetical protein
MHQQRTPEPAGEPREHAIFALLVNREEQRPWSVLELELEIGSSIAVEDSLTRLHAVGLVHRCGEFAWASRAALRADELGL